MQDFNLGQASPLRRDAAGSTLTASPLAFSLAAKGLSTPATSPSLEGGQDAGGASARASIHTGLIPGGAEAETRGDDAGNSVGFTSNSRGSSVDGMVSDMGKAPPVTAGSQAGSFGNGVRGGVPDAAVGAAPATAIGIAPPANAVDGDGAVVATAGDSNGATTSVALKSAAAASPSTDGGASVAASNTSYSRLPACFSLSSLSRTPSADAVDAFGSAGAGGNGGTGVVTTATASTNAKNNNSNSNSNSNTQDVFASCGAVLRDASVAKGSRPGSSTTMLGGNGTFFAKDTGPAAIYGCFVGTAPAEEQPPPPLPPPRVATGRIWGAVFGGGRGAGFAICSPPPVRGRTEVQPSSAAVFRPSLGGYSGVRTGNFLPPSPGPLPYRRSTPHPGYSGGMARVGVTQVVSSEQLLPPLSQFGRAPSSALHQLFAHGMPRPSWMNLAIAMTEGGPGVPAGTSDGEVVGRNREVRGVAGLTSSSSSSGSTASDMVIESIAV